MSALARTVVDRRTRVVPLGSYAIAAAAAGAMQFVEISRALGIAGFIAGFLLLGTA
jgi:hypothetical protein